MVENLLLGMSMQFIAIKLIFRVKTRVRSTHLHLALGRNELPGGRKHRRVIGSNDPLPLPRPFIGSIKERSSFYFTARVNKSVMYSHRGRGSQ